MVQKAIILFFMAKLNLLNVIQSYIQILKN